MDLFRGLLVVALVVGIYFVLASGGNGWESGEWGQCSHKCGSLGVKTRVVSCPGGECDENLKPNSVENCNRIECAKYMGCYNDGKDRVLPSLVGSWQTKQECYDLVTALDTVPKYFGLQYRHGGSGDIGTGQCWYGSDPFDKLGIADNCSVPGDEGYPGYAVGGSWSNAVYQIQA